MNPVELTGLLRAFETAYSNFSADPLFCDAEQFDFDVEEASPCSSDNSPGHVWVGAGNIGCR